MIQFQKINFDCPKKPLNKVTIIIWINIFLQFYNATRRKAPQLCARYATWGIQYIPVEPNYNELGWTFAYSRNGSVCVLATSRDHNLSTMIDVRKTKAAIPNTNSFNAHGQ